MIRPADWLAHQAAVNWPQCNDESRIAPAGFYEALIGVRVRQTNVLPFTIWSPLIDTAHQVTIPSPTTRETLVTTPTMPGLELHLPPGTVIYGENHDVVPQSSRFLYPPVMR